MIDVKTIRPFIIAVIPSGIDKGLQLSGFTSIWLAFALWSGTALLMAWALYHPIMDWKMRPAWLTAGRVKMGLLGCAAGVIGGLASCMLSPADSVLGPTVIRITKTEAIARDAYIGSPFFVNLTFVVDGETSLVDMGFKTDGFVAHDTLSSQELDERFETLHRQIKVTPPKYFGQLHPRDGKYTSIDVPHFTDMARDDVLKGEKFLYMLATWRYRLQGSNVFYVRHYCAFFLRNFNHTNACAGSHDYTFVE